MNLGWRPPPKLVNLQEKVDRGTLDLELSLDSYSGAPRGPRASSGPLLGLQSNVTNVMHLESMCIMYERHFLKLCLHSAVWRLLVFITPFRVYL